MIRSEERGLQEPMGVLSTRREEKHCQDVLDELLQ